MYTTFVSIYKQDNALKTIIIASHCLALKKGKSITLSVYLVAHELLLFNHSHLAVLSAVLIMVSIAFLFLASAKPMSDSNLHSNLTTDPFEPFSIGIQLAFHPLIFHVSRRSPYLKFSVHVPLLYVPPMEFSIPTLLFSLFYLKISLYLDVMMFEQYELGILILSLNHPLIPSLLPVTVHLEWAFSLV